MGDEKRAAQDAMGCFVAIALAIGLMIIFGLFSLP